MDEEDDMYAVRNLRLCSKDCVCLFVCPTGATDTENGQIDASKCLDGCRRCADACPSHAISFVLENYPAMPSKNKAVEEAFLALLDRKYSEENVALALGVEASPVRKILSKGFVESLRILAEDAAREANFLVPQNVGARSLIELILKEKPAVSGAVFPEAELRELLALLSE